MWGKVYANFRGQFTRKDHPHPCGEKYINSSFAFAVRGSPPPMWGKAKMKQKSKPRSRITPTHVGKSQAHLNGKTKIKDHPHPCGEKF